MNNLRHRGETRSADVNDGLARSHDQSHLMALLGVLATGWHWLGCSWDDGPTIQRLVAVWLHGSWLRGHRAKASVSPEA